MRIERATKELPAVQRGKPLKLTIDGNEVTAYEGETIATVLLAEGIRVFGRTENEDHYRGIYCGMGICYECLLTVDGLQNVRACQTAVMDGMEIETKVEAQS